MAAYWPEWGGGFAGTHGGPAGGGFGESPGDPSMLWKQLTAPYAKPANPYGTDTTSHYAKTFDDAFGKGTWGTIGDLRTQTAEQTTPEAIAARQRIMDEQHARGPGTFGGIQDTPGAGREFGSSSAGIDPIYYTRPGSPPPPGAAPGMPGGPGDLSGSPGGPGVGGGSSFTQNPFYSGMADDITRRVNQSRDIGLNAIRGNAVGVGGLGGSRQGVAEGQAISGAADNLAGQLGALGGGMWNADQSRALQRYQGDQGFYTQQRGQDMQQIGLGADLMGRGLQMPWMPAQSASGIYGGYTGFGTTSGSQQSGGGWQGLLGGGLGAANFARQMGWW